MTTKRKTTSKKEEDIQPMMTSFAASPYTTLDNQSTRQRRNVGGQIERTNRFENIETCLAAYNKKREFEGSVLNVKNLSCKKFKFKKKVDALSEINISNEL